MKRFVSQKKIQQRSQFFDAKCVRYDKSNAHKL